MLQLRQAASMRLASGAHSAATVSVSGASFVPSQEAADEVRDCHKLRLFTPPLASSAGPVFNRRSSKALWKWRVCWRVFQTFGHHHCSRETCSWHQGHTGWLHYRCGGRVVFWIACFFCCRIEKMCMLEPPLIPCWVLVWVQYGNMLLSATLPSSCCDNGKVYTKAQQYKYDTHWMRTNCFFLVVLFLHVQL